MVGAEEFTCLGLADQPPLKPGSLDKFAGKLLTWEILFLKMKLPEQDFESDLMCARANRKDLFVGGQATVAWKRWAYCSALFGQDRVVWKWFRRFLGLLRCCSKRFRSCLLWFALRFRLASQMLPNLFPSTQDITKTEHQSVQAALAGSVALSGSFCAPLLWTSATYCGPCEMKTRSQAQKSWARYSSNREVYAAPHFVKGCCCSSGTEWSGGKCCIMINGP